VNGSFTASTTCGVGFDLRQKSAGAILGYPAEAASCHPRARKIAVWIRAPFHIRAGSEQNQVQQQ